MKGKGLWASAGVAASLLVTQAVQAMTLPEPGLWEVRSQTLINDVDIDAALRQEFQKQLQQLPAQDRAALGPALQHAIEAMSPVEKECITKEEVQSLRDPQAMLAQLQKDSPECRFKLDAVKGDTIQYSGQCAAGEDGGFTGDVHGVMTMHSSRSWSQSFEGEGRFVIPAGDMKILGLDAKKLRGKVRTKLTASGRWLGAQCGAVKP
ncbi:DUF3617 domain-containing protein [Thiomonas bhubaneswarensis]|uniref:DUF3617 domain-containing protein n=1 Tax=Thiomonas bhubaneswarensis TaxID=339866 RepID=A0A0K6HY81_9BURK|nr:DUF3617 family protein [Thiomonas bhubaneswarensis]CUA95987.1 Protein of unknown function (DUF3617) [Thiomonas bhubaneswarensis]